MTRVIAIIQARMSASRLPGKVLLQIGGKPMLDWVVTRTRRSRCIDQVLVATTQDPADDPLVQYCADRGYLFFRGSQYDVLDRYYQAAISVKADVIIRITADCPFIDPELIDLCYARYIQDSADFVANRLPPPWGRTYPIGLDTEICSFTALKIAWQEAKAQYQREHVMPFLYDNPERFKIKLVNYSTDYGHYRWTVDTPEDLELARMIARRLSNEDDLFSQPGNEPATTRSIRDNFTWLEILALFEREPELVQVNASVQPKHVAEVDKRATKNESVLD